MSKKAGKDKQREKRAQRRAQARTERERKRKHERRGAETHPHELWEGESLEVPLDPPCPERLLPPIRLDRSGNAVPDPWETLGLAAGELDDARIADAYRQALLRWPPEQHPEEARRLREARDLLLDRERYLERELAVLRVPDPSAWSLPDDRGRDGLLDAKARLVGQVLLYALVEDEVTRPHADSVP